MSRFFLFQAGPVQEFIAQARSTRDLWSGSYLLSWLTAHAIHETRTRGGEVIFPAPEKQPLLDYLADPGRKSEALLTPNIPNRFFARVPDGFVAEEVVTAFRSEWLGIAEQCRQWIEGDLKSPFSLGRPGPDWTEKAWKQQVEDFWQLTWQLWPELPLGEADLLYQKIGVANEARTAVAGLDEASQAWAMNYALAEHRLSARRNTREFDAWLHPAAGQHLEKDSFSGREEAIADEVWLRGAMEHTDLKFLFRKSDPLGAVGIIKRVWHKAYLENVHDLRRKRRAFESVPAVAAATWRQKLLAIAYPKEFAKRRDARARYAARHFCDALRVADQARLVPVEVRQRHRPTVMLWRAEGSVFHETSYPAWENLATKDGLRMNGELARACDALAALRKSADLPHAPRYYAVLAMDGDHMGKWISGEMTGKVSKQFHEDFSGALADFGVKTAREIVETKHSGVLIYSGGDDVLALLPAAQAIDCARELRDEFAAAIAGVHGVTKPATASVGIAIGHMKEPLQDMVQAAQEAERRAKSDTGFGRDALAVTVFKRSGELLHWGTKFQHGERAEPHPAFALLALFTPHFREGDGLVSGRFPHELAAALGKYQTFEQTAGFPDPARPEPTTAELIEIAKVEWAFILPRQGKALVEKQPKEADALTAAAGHYLDALLATNPARPLSDFAGLFAVEEFLTRQHD